MDQASTAPGSDNLPRLLTILHREGARSRAQLTADTGLNRSTIASLVASLTDSGLAVEQVQVVPAVALRHPDDHAAIVDVVTEQLSIAR